MRFGRDRLGGEHRPWRPEGDLGDDAYPVRQAPLERGAHDALRLAVLAIRCCNIDEGDPGIDGGAQRRHRLFAGGRPPDLTDPATTAAARWRWQGKVARSAR